MADSVPDPATSGRGEQPLYTPVNAGQPGPTPPPPTIDGPAPGYTAPYPPYPYDPPARAGLDQNVAAGLAYMTVVPAVFFLLLEPYRQSRVIRFHSWQSIFFFVAFAAGRSIEMMLVAMLPSMIAFAIGSLFSLLCLIGWLIATIKAFQGTQYQLPLVGPFAASIAGSPSAP